MKFLKNFKTNESFRIINLDDFSLSIGAFFYEKNKKKKRYNISSIRNGVSKNANKNSIKRDENNSLLQQFININQKNGKKLSFFKDTNMAVNNLFFAFNDEIQEFLKYDFYKEFVYMFNNNLNYCDFNLLLDELTNNNKSIFEIKTRKNQKKQKAGLKYSHEIIYIPKKRRLKYVLRSLSLYKENFNNYELWERIFWSIFFSLVKKSSFLKKRKEFIYLKSVKFFKKKPSSLN